MSQVQNSARNSSESTKDASKLLSEVVKKVPTRGIAYLKPIKITPEGLQAVRNGNFTSQLLQTIEALEKPSKSQNTFKVIETPEGALVYTLKGYLGRADIAGTAIASFCEVLKIKVIELDVECPELKLSSDSKMFIAGVCKGALAPELEVNWGEPKEPFRIGLYYSQFLRLDREIRLFKPTLPIKFVHPAIQGTLNEKKKSTRYWKSLEAETSNRLPGLTALLKGLVKSVCANMVSDIEPVFAKHPLTMDAIKASHKRVEKVGHGKNAKTLTVEPFKASTSPFVLDREKEYVRQVLEKPWEDMKKLSERWGRMPASERLNAWKDIHSKVKDFYVEMYNTSARLGAKIAKRKKYFTLYCKAEGKLKKKEEADLSKLVRLFNEAQSVTQDSARLRFIMNPIFLMTEEHIQISAEEAKASGIDSLPGLVAYRDKNLSKTSKREITSDLLKDDNYFLLLRNEDGEALEEI